MFKKPVLALLLVVVLSQFTVPAVYAMGEPAGTCAPGFALVMTMDHVNHHHQHVGTDADSNSDGYICMKPLAPSGKIHLHIDNTLP